MNMNNRSFFIAVFVTGISFMSLSAGAQLRRLPSVVTDSFNLRFPGATKVTWKDKITVFQADFIFNNATEQAKYNSKGQWQGTEKVIRQEELPSEVKDGLSKSKYAVDWKVGTVFARSLPGDVTQYRLEIAKSDLQKRNLLFSSTGQLLKDGSTL
jgi:hypothetical protein